MTVRDFQPFTEGADIKSEAFIGWMNKVRDALCIDYHIAVTAPAAADEVDIFNVAANARRKVTLANLSKADVWTTWAPTRTGWTDVGSPTVTARYLRNGNITFFQIKVVPGTTVATVAGTSYTDLPIAAGASALAGDASMVNLTTLIAIGNCVIDTANSRCYVPTQTATGNTLEIAGWYEV